MGNLGLVGEFANERSASASSTCRRSTFETGMSPVGGSDCRESGRASRRSTSSSTSFLSRAISACADEIESVVGPGALRRFVGLVSVRCLHGGTANSGACGGDNRGGWTSRAPAVQARPGGDSRGTNGRTH